MTCKRVTGDHGPSRADHTQILPGSVPAGTPVASKMDVDLPYRVVSVADLSGEITLLSIRLLLSSLR